VASGLIDAGRLGGSVYPLYDAANATGIPFVVAALFTGKGINRVPVTAVDGRLLGIVTRGDLIKAALGGAAK
jgi:CBS domain-containing protein